MKPSPTNAAREERTLVIGLARTGLAVARHELAAGRDVRVIDRRRPAELGAAVAELEQAGVDLRLGAEELTALDGVTLVIPSPGVAADAPLLREAVRRGIAVVSEIERAAAALSIPILAVTGTNGK